MAGLALTAAAGVPAFAAGQKAVFEQANADLQAGAADQALALLNELARPGGPAEAYNLKCRVEYSLEEWDQAVNDCQQAVRLNGGSSDDHLWLGRALGEKASRASFLSAYSLGKQVRIEFEEAVRLDPRNAAALSDLGEFYYSAPGFMGGGSGKAENVAAELDRIDPARADELRGGIAEQNKDYATAEREYKQAIARSAHPAGAWMALANFYRHRQRWTEMEQAVRSGQSAAARDRQPGSALYDGASLLLETNRDPERAAKMLEDYLSGRAKTEQAPAFAAYVKLAQLQQKLGDRADAVRDRAAALALAREYKPAQELKH